MVILKADAKYSAVRLSLVSPQEHSFGLTVTT